MFIVYTVESPELPVHFFTNKQTNKQTGKKHWLHIIEIRTPEDLHAQNHRESVQGNASKVSFA